MRQRLMVIICWIFVKRVCVTVGATLAVARPNRSAIGNDSRKVIPLLGEMSHSDKRVAGWLQLSLRNVGKRLIVYHLLDVKETHNRAKAFPRGEGGTLHAQYVYSFAIVKNGAKVGIMLRSVAA